MFSRYYTSEQVPRYQASPHKVRIDHVAGSLVARRYRDGTVAAYLREWLRLTTYFDRRGVSLPSPERLAAAHRADSGFELQPRRTVLVNRHQMETACRHHHRDLLGRAAVTMLMRLTVTTAEDQQHGASRS